MLVFGELTALKARRAEPVTTSEKQPLRDVIREDLIDLIDETREALTLGPLSKLPSGSSS